jgi:hypothetical protein
LHSPVGWGEQDYFSAPDLARIAKQVIPATLSGLTAIALHGSQLSVQFSVIVRGG